MSTYECCNMSRNVLAFVPRSTPECSISILDTKTGISLGVTLTPRQQFDLAVELFANCIGNLEED